MSALLAFALSPTGRWLVIAAVSASAFFGVWEIRYWKGYSDGKAHVQAQWDTAVKLAIEQGEQARRDAGADVADDSPAELRDDPYNRDKR